MEGFICKTCGQRHEGYPLSYIAEAPAYWYAIPEKQRKKRAHLDGETCIVDDEHFFILGNIPLPIQDSEQHFQWTVWVSLSAQNFKRALDLWNQPGRENEPSYFGWLSTFLPETLYPETLHLKTQVHTQPVGVRPLIELEPTDHPLAVEQREGITWARVQQIAEILLHPAD